MVVQFSLANIGWVMDMYIVYCNSLHSNMTMFWWERPTWRHEWCIWLKCELRFAIAEANVCCCYRPITFLPKTIISWPSVVCQPGPTSELLTLSPSTRKCLHVLALYCLSDLVNHIRVTLYTRCLHKLLLYATLCTCVLFPTYTLVFTYTLFGSETWHFTTKALHGNIPEHLPAI